MKEKRTCSLRPFSISWDFITSQFPTYTNKDWAKTIMGGSHRYHWPMLWDAYTLANTFNTTVDSYMAGAITNIKPDKRLIRPTRTILFDKFDFLGLGRSAMTPDIISQLNKKNIFAGFCNLPGDRLYASGVPFNSQVAATMAEYTDFDPGTLLDYVWVNNPIPVEVLIPATTADWIGGELLVINYIINDAQAFLCPWGQASGRLSSKFGGVPDVLHGISMFTDVITKSLSALQLAFALFERVDFHTIFVRQPDGPPFPGVPAQYNYSDTSSIMTTAYTSFTPYGATLNDLGAVSIGSIGSSIIAAMQAKVRSFWGLT